MTNDIDAVHKWLARLVTLSIWLYVSSLNQHLDKCLANQALEDLEKEPSKTQTILRLRSQWRSLYTLHTRSRARFNAVYDHREL